MEKITTRKELIERLKDIKCVEMEARESYIKEVSTFKNFKIKKDIEKIKEYEDEHMNILDTLINMLEEN